jgi:hypothetical protein
VPRPYSFVILTQYQQDTHTLGRCPTGAITRRFGRSPSPPKDALSVVPVYRDRSDGWTEYVLTFPLERGELLYEIDEAERIIMLRHVAWGRPG